VSVGLRQRQVPLWEAYWTGLLEPETGWPAARLGIVAFCSTTSERRIFEARDGVPLTRAIAASTAVPGIIGAVGIDARHHVDAGPHDSTSADLAAGFDDVLILAPDTNPGELARSIPRLESEGARVTVLEPSDPASFGEGIQHLDAMRIPAAVALGFRDGRAAAERLQGLD
jgi:NTE family protein